MSAHRRWCFTLNLKDKTIEDAETAKSSLLATVGPAGGLVRYMVVGIETAPTTGMIHLQGYVEVTKPRALSSIKTLIGANSVHVEPAKGNSKQASDYCKKDGNFSEIGQISNQGKRTDLTVLRESIVNGASMEDIAEQDFGSYLRYQRSLTKYRALCLKHLNYQKPKVIVRWGSPGSGKTRFIYDNHDDADVWAWPGSGWFDGYDFHEVALFDDFDGSCFGFRHLLRILDRYKIDVPVKGDYVPFRPKVIYFTSNKHPQDWYPSEAGDYTALERRIDEITFVEMPVQ